MKKTTILLFLLLALLKTHAQDYFIGFAGMGDTNMVNSVKVENLMSGDTLTMNGSDILHLAVPVGIGTRNSKNRDIHIYPNPMSEQSALIFSTPENGNTVISIVNLSGKTICQAYSFLTAGVHRFRISGISRGIYFVKVAGVRYFHSAKLISQSSFHGRVGIEYVSTVKNTTENLLKSDAAMIDMPYNNGDQLLFKGISGQYSTVISDLPTVSKTLTFNFAACTDADNNNYATVTIGAQTWMAENLNVGVLINGIQEQANNGIVEKCCYNNDENYCSIYGGLYSWYELMQYINTPGAQGICPSGWHIPTDTEWTTLSTYLSGEAVTGGKIKYTGTIEAGTGMWYSPNTGANNESGFSAIPAGTWEGNGIFNYVGFSTNWWSSSGNLGGDAWCRYVEHNISGLNRYYDMVSAGFSVRCLSDFTGQVHPDYLIGFTGVGDTSTVSTIEVYNLTNGATAILNGGDTLHLTGSKGAGDLGTIEMPYTYGDRLLYKGISGHYSTVVTDLPSSSKTVAFNFIACTDADNHNYAIEQIGTQTWMAENLNVGVHIVGNQSQTDNGIVERYCYNDEAGNCDTYGGLYLWNEMMQYSTTPGLQGICPTGWHIPTDAEIVTLITNQGGFSVAGGKMKSTGTLESGTGLWFTPNTGATNECGMSVIPAGNRSYNGTFLGVGSKSNWWSSTENNATSAMSRKLTYNDITAAREINSKVTGFSVRCLRDSIYQVPQEFLINFESTGDTNVVNTVKVENLMGGDTLTLNGEDTLHLIRSKGNNILGPNDMSYTDGDRLLFKGITGQYRTVVADLPFSNKTITFNSVACTDADNNNYATVAIGSQTWMAENLKVGIGINGAQEQTNNGVIERYCYNDDINNCQIYGGLYQWTEMMQYDTTPGVQGICPTGWHLPSDDEWCTVTQFLEPIVDCDVLGYSGINVGGKIKSTGTLWEESGLWTYPNAGATNEVGFSAVPAGIRNRVGWYLDYENGTYFWSSSKFDQNSSWYRQLYYSIGNVGRGHLYINEGYSVRCIRDL